MTYKYVSLSLFILNISYYSYTGVVLKTPKEHHHAPAQLTLSIQVPEESGGSTDSVQGGEQPAIQGAGVGVCRAWAGHLRGAVAQRLHLFAY